MRSWSTARSSSSEGERRIVADVLGRIGELEGELVGHEHGEVGGINISLRLQAEQLVVRQQEAVLHRRSDRVADDPLPQHRPESVAVLYVRNDIADVCDSSDADQDVRRGSSVNGDSFA